MRRGKRYTITPSLSLSLIPQPTTPSSGAPPSPNDQPQYRSVLLSFAFPSQAQRVVDYLSGPTDANGLSPEDYDDLRRGMPLSTFLLCEQNMCDRRGLGCLAPRTTDSAYASARIGATTNGSFTTTGSATTYVTPPPATAGPRPPCSPPRSRSCAC